MNEMAHLLAVFNTVTDSAEGMASWMPWQSQDGYSLGWRAEWLEDPERYWYFYTRVRVDGVTNTCYSGPHGDWKLDHPLGHWSMDLGGDGD
jgi:hypothetical protein